MAVGARGIARKTCKDASDTVKALATSASVLVVASSILKSVRPASTAATIDVTISNPPSQTFQSSWYLAVR